ncbi:IS66 family insertion sequence element accessory protein TnpA [uncultured Bacteroides sp.]
MTQVQFEEVYNRFKGSGLNVRDFCNNEGFTESRFYYWQKKRNSANKSSGLIPLLIDKSASVPAVNHAQSKAQSCRQPDNDFAIEVSYLNGATLRIKGNVDPSVLRTLIHLDD